MQSIDDFLDELFEPNQAHAQGGGLVEWDGAYWRFTQDAPDGFNLGDKIPNEWSIAVCSKCGQHEVNK